MAPMAQFAVLAVVTALAGTASFLMAWAFLWGAFQLMQPAATRPSRRGSPLVQGTRALAQPFGLRR
jgi:hypothetical protein